MDRDARAPFGLIALFVSIAAFSLATALAVAVAGDRDSGSGTAPAGPVAVSLTEFGITPASFSASGELVVTNDGTMAHDLHIAGTDLATPVLQPGQSATLDLAGLEPGTYSVICTIAGHEQAGMTATLTVGGDGGLMTAEQAAAMDQKMLESILAFPAETEGIGNQVLEPEVLADGTKRFELTAAITDWEVAPGQVVQAWTYNGMVPGPMFVLDVGDPACRPGPRWATWSSPRTSRSTSACPWRSTTPG